MSSRANFLSVSPLGSHTYVSANSVVTITVNPNASVLLLGAQGASCRYTLDGTTPTASVGFLLGSSAGPVRLDLVPGTVVKVQGTGAFINYQQLRRF